MRMLIIRHGESEADLLNVYEGRADFDLTANGHKQAKVMSEWVKTRYCISKIYSSPLKRAFQTATYLSQIFNLVINVEDKLMEFNNGLIAGVDKKIAQEKYPFVGNPPIHSSVYEQESKLDFRFRADYILSKIISETKENETIALVSHGKMINQLFLSFMELPVSSSVFYTTGDTGIHEWIYDSNLKQIVFSNSRCHII